MKKKAFRSVIILFIVMLTLTVYNIGDCRKINDITYTVTSFEKTNRVKAIDRIIVSREGYTFLLVGIRIENNAKESITVSASDWHLVDEQDVKFDAKTSKYIYNDMEKEDLPPYDTREYILYFAVPDAILTNKFRVALEQEEGIFPSRKQYFWSLVGKE